VIKRLAAKNKCRIEAANSSSFCGLSIKDRWGLMKFSKAQARHHRFLQSG
jgi:hypothetical protein